MNAETKEFLRGIMSNAVGTLVAAAILAVLAFFAGKINLFIQYWKELSLALFIIFIAVTGIVWFRKLLKLERCINDIQSQPKMCIDYSPQIKEVEKNINSDISKINSKLNSMSSELNELKRDQLYIQAEKHQKKNQRGALYCRLNVVELDVTTDNQYNLDDSLEELSGYVRGEDVFTTSDLSKAKETFEKIKWKDRRAAAEHILDQITQKVK